MDNKAIVERLKQLGLQKDIHWVILEENGKPYVTLDGLLYLSQNHPEPQKRTKSIDAEVLDPKLPIVKVTVTLNDGSTFSGLGSASDGEETERKIELAEGRATSRALRKAYALGVPVKEPEESNA
ncbi:hypothetical protein GFV12_02975 [Desulfurobacterium thermolithotrophum]|uniref:hypothetical protein n=1 Tax=Desulfurobacterium thermolithotrophum TaxID=64160 RepID=UPI0013D5CCE4|nr:hypothetical protein [Desulfurobacterium thermolithotrophum]